MQWPAMRYGVGLPLQLWMLGVGVIMLMEYFSRPMVRVTHAPVRPIGEHPARRAGEGMISHPEPPAPVQPTPPAATGGGAAGQGGYSAGVSHPTGAKIPHPALAPEPEQPQQQQRPTGTDPARPKPPQIFPG
jgi:hypothetical protein